MYITVTYSTTLINPQSTHYVLERLKNIETKGTSQCDEFMSECLEECKKSLYDPIQWNKLCFFVSGIAKKTAKAQQQLSLLKSDCAFFS